MSNTLTGLSNTLMAWDAGIVQSEINNVLNPVAAKITAFGAFASRFANIQASNGTINVPIPTYATGSSTGTGGTIIISNGVTTNAQLTLANDWYQYYAFNPVEAQSSGLSNLIQTFVAPAIYAVEATILSASLAVVATNFSTSSLCKPPIAASGSLAQFINLNADLSNNGINTGDRILCLLSSYYWQGLMQDLSNKNNSAGANAIQSGNPNNPLGMVVSEVSPTYLPSVNNLVGFGGTKGGIIVGTAIPNLIHGTGTSMVVTSPNGIPMLLETFVNDNTRQWVIGASVVGNAVKGNNSLLRIVSS